MFSRKGVEKRLLVFILVIAGIFIGLGGRLFYLQVVRAEQYKVQSAENRLRPKTIPARRGDIFDRNGNVLATSKPVFVISLSPLFSKRSDWSLVLKRLVVALNDPEITAKSLEAKISEKRLPFESVEVKVIPWGEEGLKTVTRLEEKSKELPGVVISEQPRRSYPMGSVAGHVMGYVSAISPLELDSLRDKGYGRQDLIGKTGVERAFELLPGQGPGGRDIGLRGLAGSRQVEVDASGTPVRDLPVLIPSVPGDNLKLTLDTKLQQVMDASMDEVIAGAKIKNVKAGGGAAVLLDVKTGAILAMSSKPDLNPDDFVDGLSSLEASGYAGNKTRSYTNRVIRSAYPPGSTFKMVTGIAALESGAVKPTDKIVDRGRYEKPGGAACWDVHGTVDMNRAFAVSCNTYFQWAGDQAGIDQIVRVARELGLGEATGVQGLVGERIGILATPQWKYNQWSPQIIKKYEKKRQELNNTFQNKIAGLLDDTERQRVEKQWKREAASLEAAYKSELRDVAEWRPYDTYYTSMGQGGSFTVMQLAEYVTTLANGGYRWRPYLVQEISDPKGKVLWNYQPELLARANLDPVAMAEVRRGMRAVTEPGGTSFGLFASFPPELAVAAKTGTAQTGLQGDDKKKDFHGLFVAFAPYDNPQIAFAGIVEYGDSGSGSIGKVAKAVFETYFNLNQDEEIPTKEQA